MKLRTKFSIIISIAILLITMISEISIYRAAKKEVLLGIEYKLKTTLNSRAKLIESTLTSYKKITTLFATGEILKKLFTYGNINNELRIVNNRISTIVEDSPDIIQIRILNIDGSTKLTYNINKGIDPSDKDIFRIWKQNHIPGKTFISEINNNNISIIKEIPDYYNNIKGIIIFDFDLNVEIYPILTDSLYLGNSGEVYLVNMDTIMVSPSRFEDNALPNHIKINTKNYREAKTLHFINEKPEYLMSKLEEYPDHRGVQVLGNHYYLNELKCVIISEIDAEEAYKPIRKLLIRFFIIIAITIIILSIVISNILSQIILRPLSNIISGIDYFKKGNFDFKINVPGEDELSQLATQFNQMANSIFNAEQELKVYSDGLSKLVEKRTRELELKTKEAEIQREDIFNIYQELDKSNTQLKEDFKKQKEMEEKLLESESKFRTLADYGNDWEYWVDPLGCYLFCSPSCKKITGYSAGEFYDNPALLDTIIAEEHYDSVHKHYSEDHHNIGEHSEFIFQIKHKSGKLVWIEHSCVSIYDRENNYIGRRGSNRDITQRKIAQMALQENEKEINSIFKSAPIGIGLVIDRRLMRVNESLCKITGYEREELIGQNTRILYPSDEDYNWVGKEKYKQISEKGTGSVDTQFKRKNGQIIDIILSSTPINIDDLSQGVTFTVLDISEKTLYQKSLKKSETNYKKLIEGLPDIVYKYNKEKGSLFWSDSVEDVLGYTPNYLLAHPHIWYDSIHPDDKNIIDQSLENFDKGQHLDMEYRVQHKLGHWIWMRDRSYNRVEENEMLILYGIATDITARKMAEEKISRFNFLLEKSVNEIYVFDAYMLKFNEVNQSAVNNTGFSREELLTMSPWELGSEYPEEKLKDTLLRPLLEGNKDIIQFKNVHIRKDGSQYPVDVYLQLVTYKRKKNFVAIILDVSEKKVLEEQLRQSQKLEGIGQLAGGIAHDFNNILTALIGFTEVASYSTEKGSKAHNAILQIQQANERAKNLVRQLLAFSRKQTFTPELIEINNVLQHLNKMLTNLIGEDIEIEMKLNHQDIYIMADPIQIEQIIINLFVNARDAILENKDITTHKKITVSTSIKHKIDIKNFESMDLDKSQFAVIKICDTGIGMNPQLIKNIFEPFFTTKEIGRGTGLGLSTVYGIVKQNKAHIMAESEFGEGTCFTLYWPFVSEGAMPLKSEEIDKSTLQGKESILFVEDDELVLNITAEMLRSYGYNVMVASNGLSAFEVAESLEFNFDMLITDVRMPRMGGRELAIKILEKCSDIKILFCSGYNEEIVRDGGIMDKSIPMIAKPFSSIDLLHQIRDILDNE